MKLNPTPASVCTARVVCVGERVSLGVCLGKDGGQQGTGWVQGRRREIRVFVFQKGRPAVLHVQCGGGHWPLLSIISIIFSLLNAHRFPRHFLLPALSFFQLKNEWLFGVNYVWLRDDAEWMGLWECESWMRSWKSYLSLTSDQGTAVSNESVILSQSAEQLWGEEGGAETKVWSVVFMRSLFGCRFTGAICV